MGRLIMARFEDDLYVIDEIYQSYLSNYWSGKPTNSIHLNHASITAPLPFVHQAALKVQQESLPIDSVERLAIIENTRKKVAQLVNLQKDNVAFANNTTDAASLVFWLAGLKKGNSVITTDAENESIPRIFRYYMDHANRSDGWTSWQNFAQYSNSEANLVAKRPTGVEVRVVRAYETSDRVFLKNLLSNIDESTKLVVFCHVLRENGRIMPVKEICRSIHEINQEIHVLVDGAQCLGTLPRIDFSELGCDFYVATPHKTLCSETTGLLFIHPKNLNLCSRINSVPRKRQIIKKDQFSEELGIQPNSEYAISLPEIYALNLIIDYYKETKWVVGNDFSAVDRYLKRLKESMIKMLSQSEAEIVSPISPEFTNFICSFRYKSVNNRELVRKLWNRNIFVSYIHRSNVIRTSFSISNTLEEIDRFESEVKRMVTSKKP